MRGTTIESKISYSTLNPSVPRPLGVVDTRGVVRFRSRDTLFLNEGVQETANVICDLSDLFSLEVVDELVIEKLAMVRCEGLKYSMKIYAKILLLLEQYIGWIYILYMTYV